MNCICSALLFYEYMHFLVSVQFSLNIHKIPVKTQHIMSITLYCIIDIKYTDNILTAVYHGFTSSMILTLQQNSIYKYILPTFNFSTAISIRYVRTSQHNTILAFKHCKLLITTYTE